jgi:uncharacterized protein with GYD domain
VVLVNWTEQGITNVKEAVERTERGEEIAHNRYGASLKQRASLKRYDNRYEKRFVTNFREK